MQAGADGSAGRGHAGVRGEFPDQMEAALPACRVSRYEVGLGHQDGIREGEFAQQEFTGRPLVVGHRREAGFEQGM